MERKGKTEREAMLVAHYPGGVVEGKPKGDAKARQVTKICFAYLFEKRGYMLRSRLVVTSELTKRYSIPEW
jgi:hypothetical protein